MGVQRVFCAGCEEAVRCATANHCAYFCGLCGRVCFPSSANDEERRSQRKAERLLAIDRPTAFDRKSTLADHVATFVVSVLVWDVKRVRLEQRSLLRSTFTGVLVATELGIVGSGCSSSVGPYSAAATRGEQLPPLDARLVADGEARYHALSGEHRETVDLICDDERGLNHCDVVLVPDQPARSLSLATRIGLQLAKPGQRRDWFRKIAERDSRGALFGANELGTKRLDDAAKQWFASSEHEQSTAENAAI